MDTVVLILAGGVGNRLWPFSSKEKPKQFLSLETGGPSFFQQTYRRALKITDASHIFVLTRREYKNLVLLQLPHISEDNVFLEYDAKNTAPAIATAALKIQNRFENVLTVVLPSDSYISDDEVFYRDVQNAIKAADKTDKLVTLGITPTRPDTNYGYIKCFEENFPDVYEVSQFTEKPSQIKAMEFLGDKDYYWNIGFLISKNSILVEQFRMYLPEVVKCAEKACLSENIREEEDHYKSMPAISVDYGLLEKSKDVLMVKGHFGWDDIGTWAALERICPVDKDGNVTVGNCEAKHSRNCTVVSEHGSVITVGTQDLLIVKSRDTVVVSSKDSIHEISGICALYDKE